MNAVIYSETFKVRAPEPMVAAVRQAAEAEHMTISEYVRAALRLRLREDAQDSLFRDEVADVKEQEREPLRLELKTPRGRAAGKR